MALTIHSDVAGHRHELRPTAALRQAWYWYLALAFIPFLVFLAVVITLNYREGTPPHLTWRNTAFIVPIVFLFVMGPVSFAIRSKLFRSYWRGEPVSPRDYLLGMLVVWTTFEIAGLLSLLGCFVSNSLLPGLLPALASFIFFTCLWPNGRAMVRPTGSDDPEMYREPR